MLKRTLVSSAIVAALSAPVMAGELEFVEVVGGVASTTGDLIISYEGSEGTDAIELPTIEVQIEANYLNDDILAVSFTSALDTSLQTGELSVDLGDFSSGLEIESIDFTTNTIYMRVVSEGLAFTSGDNIYLSGVRLDVAALRTIDVDADYSVDAGYENARVANMTFNSFRGELTNEIKDANGDSYATDFGEDVYDDIVVVDQFTSGTNSGVLYVDTSGVRSLDSSWSNFIMNDAAGSAAANGIIKIDGDTELLDDDITELLADVDSVTHVITGDFKMADGSDLVTTGLSVHLDTPDLVDVTSALGADDITITPTTLTITLPASVYDANVVAVDTVANANYNELDAEDALFDLVVDFNGAAFGIGAGTMTASTTVNYTTAAAAESSSTFADTSKVDVEFLGKRVAVRSMPFGSNIDPFVWISNGSAVPARVMFDIVYDGERFGPFDAGIVDGMSNTRIAGLISDAAAANSITSGRGDVIITLTDNDTVSVDGFADFASTFADEYVGTPWLEENGAEDLSSVESYTVGSGQLNSSYANVNEVGGVADSVEETSVNEQFMVSVTQSTPLTFNVYAGYKVVSDSDRLNLPVEVLSDGVDSNQNGLPIFLPN